MGQLVKMAAVGGGIVFGAMQIDSIVKTRGWVASDASYAKFTPYVIGGLLLVGAHKAGLV